MGKDLKKEGCQCFTCRNKDNLDRLYGYYYAEYQAESDILNTLKELGIKRGSIADKTLEGLYACVEYNRDCAGAFLEEIEREIKEREEKDGK